MPLLHVLLHVLLLRANGFRHSITQPSGHISAAMIQDDFGQGAGNTSIGSHHGTIQTVSRMSAMRAYHSIPQSANGALGTQWTDERFRHSLTQATSGSAVRARPNFTQSIHSANNAPHCCESSTQLCTASQGYRQCGHQSQTSQNYPSGCECSQPEPSLLRVCHDVS